MKPEELKNLILEAASADDIARVIVLLKRLCMIRVAEGCICKAAKIVCKINHLEDIYRERVAPWN
jgi:hypothetical protein